MKKYEDVIHEYLVERNWDHLRPGDLAKSISIETAELLELFQWTNPSLEEVRKNPELLEQIKSELADVFIYGLDMSVLLGFDTGELILQKLKKAREKYPVELFKDRDPSKDAGSEDIYWEIKHASRLKDK